MFKIFKIRSYISRVKRGIGIAFILLGYLWVNWMSGRKFTRIFIAKKYKRNGSVISTHERLRMVIERLGPTFVKFGQILADRPDLVSDKLRIELKKLQSAANPIDDDLAFELIEKELGGPIENYFDNIDPRCIGSASIGQVYKGRLKTGEEVVIKIQRPNIKEKIKLDLELLKILAGRLAAEYPEFVVMDIQGFVTEFGETLMRELNYFNEAANAMRFADMFKDVPYCKIPRIYTDLSTHRMLVMELVHGISPDNVYELHKRGLDPKVVAKNGTEAFLKMIFEHGFFHADPHAGNLFVQENNRVALIDFGMAGSLKPSHMQFLANFTLGLATKNPQTVSDALLKLSGIKFFKDKEDLEFQLQEMLNRYGSLSYEKINFSQVLDECVRIILKFELKIPSSIYLLIKALATVEKLGYNLDPKISLAASIKPYAISLIAKQYSPKKIAGELFDFARDFVNLVRNFPGEVSEIMHNVKQGRLIHDIRLGNEEAFGKSMRNFARSLSLAFILGFMMIGSGIMLIWGAQDYWVVKAMFVVSSFIACWMLLRTFFTVKV